MTEEDRIGRRSVRNEFVSLGVVVPGSRLPTEHGRYFRFDVLVGPVLVPVLLWLNARYSDRLLIASNGAVVRKKGESPADCFQRSSWVESFRSHTLFIADPTLQESNSISIGWGQGSPGAFALPAISQAAQWVADGLGVPSSRRLYFGSSAGGFQAMQLATRDAGSRCIVNNPQIDWTLYKKSFVRSVCDYSYSGMSATEVSAEFPHRTSVVNAFVESGYVPPTKYLVNTASADDLGVHLPELMSHMDKLSAIMAGRRIDVSPYYDVKSGHNPLPKVATLFEVNDTLDDLE